MSSTALSGCELRALGAPGVSTALDSGAIRAAAERGTSEVRAAGARGFAAVVRAARRPTALLLFACFLGPAHDGHADDEIERWLADLGLDLADQRAYDAINGLQLRGPGVIPTLCAALDSTPLLELGTQESVRRLMGVTLVFSALAHKDAKTLEQTLPCLFDWSVNARFDVFSQLHVRSEVAVGIGDVALEPLLEAALASPGWNAEPQDTGVALQDWLLTFCLRREKEAATVDTVFAFASVAETELRLRLYGHVAALAGCSDRAVEVLRGAMAEAATEDERRRIRALYLQAERWRRESLSEASRTR